MAAAMRSSVRAGAVSARRMLWYGMLMLALPARVSTRLLPWRSGAGMAAGRPGGSGSWRCRPPPVGSVPGPASKPTAAAAAKGPAGTPAVGAATACCWAARAAASSSLLPGVRAASQSDSKSCTMAALAGAACSGACSQGEGCGAPRGMRGCRAGRGGVRRGATLERSDGRGPRALCHSSASAAITAHTSRPGEAQSPRQPGCQAVKSAGRTGDFRRVSGRAVLMAVSRRCTLFSWSCWRSRVPSEPCRKGGVGVQ